MELADDDGESELELREDGNKVARFAPSFIQQNPLVIEKELCWSACLAGEDVNIYAFY